MSQAEPPSTIPELLAAVVPARHRHDAVATPDETIDYAELDRRSAAIARALLAGGAGKGTRVALLANDSIFFVTAFLGALRIGALVTVISTLATPPELAHILRNSDVEVLLSVRRFMAHDYAAKLEAAFPGLAEASAGALRLCEAPFLRAVWFNDAEGCCWAGGMADFLARAGGIDPALLAAAESRVSPADDAVIVYTSGSTALPKAVLHTQWNVSRHPAETAMLFLIEPEDRMLPMLPAFWLGGMMKLLEVIGRGATLVYPRSPDLEDVCDAIVSLRANRLNGWGDGLARLRALAPERGIDMTKVVGLDWFRDKSGNPIPPERQSGMLGMSETFGPHSAEPLDFVMPEGKEWCCGRPVNGYERRIVDPGTGDELGPDTVGELQLRGGALMKGFYGRRDCEVFTPDGFYPTGDLCRIDADDFLYFVARRSDMIKTRAANVSRLEVEAALRELPSVANAVVAGIDHAEYGQVVAAAIVPAGAPPDPDAIRAALRETLSSYKVPRVIVTIAEEDIPRTQTGKLRLGDLATLIEARINREDA